MTLNYVTLTLDLYDGSGNYPVSGTASFAPSAVLTDAGAEIVSQQPITVTFRAGSLPTVPLLATDNSGPLPAGWTWGVTFDGITGAPAGFSFFLPYTDGASQVLSNQIPVGSGTAFQAYMPVPPGTPTAGEVPSATGAGTATQWVSIPAVSLTQAQQYQTTSDLSAPLTQIQPPPFSAVPPGFQPVIVKPDEQYQQWLGCGAAITDATAYCLMTYLTALQRAAFLTSAFSPRAGNLSMVRIGFGYTDFQSASNNYTYDDMPVSGMTDPGLLAFSILQDGVRIIPVLQQIKAIQPRLRIFASVWSPPGWMCSSGNTVSSGHYQDFANYLVAAVQAYAAAGLPIHAIAPVNEPSNNGYTEAAMAALIGTYIGPAFQAAGLTTQIMAGDDQWTEAATFQGPLLTDTTAGPFIGSVAWHCYTGNPQGMTTAAQAAAPTKAQHITEIRTLLAQSTGISLGIMAGYVFGYGLRNWAQSVTLWNLMLDQNGAPNNGASTGRRGVVTVQNTGSGALSYSAEWYVMQHFSKFLQAGARRIASSNYATPVSSYNASSFNAGTMAGAGLQSVAFLNPDESVVCFVFNPTASSISTVISDARFSEGFPVTLASLEMGTFVWGTTVQATPAGTPVTIPAPSAPALTANGQNGQILLSWPAVSSAQPVSSYTLNHSTSTGTETAYITLPPGATSYTYLNPSGETGYFTLTATSPGGSATSTEVSATCAARTGPSAPTFISAVGGSGEITLTWSYSATLAQVTVLTVLRGTTSGGETTLINLPAGSTSYVDSSVSDGTVYYYKIRTSNSSGSGTSSELPASTTGTSKPLLDTIGGGAATQSSPATWTHTVSPNLSNGSILIVAVANSGSSNSSNDVSGVTYGGTPMTLVPSSDVASSSSTSRRISQWYLLDPPAGSATVSVTWNTTNTPNLAGQSMSFSHVNQSGALGTCGTNTTTSGTSLAATTTSSSATDIVVATIAVRNNSPSPAGGQTQVYLEPYGTNTYNEGSTQAGGGGTITSTFTWSGADNAAIAAVPIHGA